MSNISKSHLLLALIVTAAGMAACGGQQTPAETPAPAEEATEPSSAEGDESGGEGEHTMPDGTKMPGHHHDEGGQSSEESDHEH